MSKGFTDLAGIGKVIGELRKLAQYLLKHWSEQRRRILEDEEQSLKNQQLKLKNDALAIKNRILELQLFDKFMASSRKYKVTPIELGQSVGALAPPQQHLVADKKYLPSSSDSVPS